MPPEDKRKLWEERLDAALGVAASAILFVVVACLGWQTGYAPAHLALIAAHSDGPERGAVLLAEETA